MWLLRLVQSGEESQWSLRDAGDGLYKIVSEATGSALGAVGGNVVLVSPNGQKNRWKVQV